MERQVITDEPTTLLDLQDKIKSYGVAVNNLAKLAINAPSDYIADIYNIYLNDCENRCKKLKKIEKKLIENKNGNNNRK